MKTKNFILAASLSLLPFVLQSHATDENLAVVKVGTTYRLAWEHAPNTLIPESRFVIYTNGVAAQVLTTNNFSILSSSGGTNTYTAQFVAPMITSKDVITLTAVNEMNEESEPANALTLYTLGKPKRPEGLRKR